MPLRGYKFIVQYNPLSESRYTAVKYCGSIIIVHYYLLSDSRKAVIKNCGQIIILFITICQWGGITGPNVSIQLVP